VLWSLWSWVCAGTGGTQQAAKL